MRYLTCNADSAIATCLKKPKKSPTKKAHHPARHFAYSDILAATNAFSAENFLGKGSHGSVYKATLDAGTLIAAVKVTKPSNEIQILSHVKTRRLVNLIGFCNDQANNNNKLIVVEYMPNGSLHDLLHSSKPVQPPSWTARLRFAVQIAKAVRGLHAAQPPVIHRDIKSSNVLIDKNWNARLADFGLALRGHVADFQFFRVPPAGTLGYLDPCYLAPGDLTFKSDVFSFGVLLLEIASGRRAIDVSHSPPSLLDWALPLLRRGHFDKICDPRIGAPPDMAAFRRLVTLAARCVRSAAERRPEMAEVVECLAAVRKCFRAGVMWKRLKRRVVAREGMNVDWDRSEEVVTVSSRNCRRNGKVSSVSGGPANPAVSFGSVGSGDVKINSALDGLPNQIRFGFGTRKGRVAVTRITRSSSTGVLGHNGNNNNNNNNNNDTVGSIEIALSKLGIMDKKLEERLLEKPLVYY